MLLRFMIGTSMCFQFTAIKTKSKSRKEFDLNRLMAENCSLEMEELRKLKYDLLDISQKFIFLQYAKYSSDFKVYVFDRSNFGYLYEFGTSYLMSFCFVIEFKDEQDKNLKGGLGLYA